MSFARRPSTSGFTLLEVLAAAMIMAMFYGVLSAKGVEGFVLEGDADRRLRASLVADRRLADLEAARVTGQAPRVGTVEAEEDGFAVRVEVGPFALPLDQFLPEEDSPGGGRAARGPRPPSLLAPPARGRAAPLLAVHVVVSWNDGRGDHSVERTTFALDREALAEVLTRAGLANGVDGEGSPVFGGNSAATSAGGSPGADSTRNGNNP